MNLKSSFIQHLMQKYPAFSAEKLDGYVSENLLSPFQVPLKKSVLEDIKKQIAGYWQLRKWSASHLASHYEKLGLFKPSNYAVCMSYDFHVAEDNRLELIEINTNASFLALGLELYDLWKIKNPAANFGETELVQMFRDEMKLVGGLADSVAITDEHPDQQRLFIEFLVYQSLFEKHGVKAHIVNIDAIEEMEKASIVYNRYTDFYLHEEKSLALKQAFNAGLVHLSPHPWEYFLSADKQRLIDWNKQTEVTKPSSLLPVYDLEFESPEKMWNERKQLFFKPKTSFGSKQAYRGGSMSKKVFDEVCGKGFIAQQISTPSEIDVVFNNENTKLKYDLRCYVYKNELQLIIARLYQGQTTNLRTAGGGFACVTAVD